MIPYWQFRPSRFDAAGLGCEDRQEWLVAPCSRNRDSECLSESNWASQLALLGGEGDDVEVHRFGHWGPGWFEIVLVRPDSPAAKEAEKIENRLEDYPVLDEEHFSQLESETANEIWSNSYSNSERIVYIRDHRSQFEFHDMADLMGCVRGRYFAGYASELIG